MKCVSLPKTGVVAKLRHHTTFGGEGAPEDIHFDDGTPKSVHLLLIAAVYDDSS